MAAAFAAPPEIGTPYGVTHTHFAIVPRSALGSKSPMILRDKIRLAVASVWSFIFEIESFRS
jgi:hypothetical protein